MKRKKMICAGAGLACCVLLSATAGTKFLHAAAGEGAPSYRETELQHGDLQLSFTGEGTTTEGTILQEADFDLSASDLIVEEVYAKSGDKVAQGDALYKLSEDSVKNAADYYDEAIAEAAKKSERAVAAYQAGKLNAEYTRDASKAEANAAKENMEIKNRSKEQEAEKAKSALAEVQELIGVYQTNLEQEQYYKDAAVSEKKEASEKAGKSAEQAKQEQERTAASYEEAVRSVCEKIAGLKQDAQTASDAVALFEQIAELESESQALTEKKKANENAKSAWEAAQKEEKEKEEAYQAAILSYEKAVSEASARKEELERSLPSLQLACTNAENAAKTEQVKNQSDCDAALLQGEYADDIYEKTVASLQADADAADRTLQELRAEQGALLALADGVVTANRDGRLAGILYEAGDTLISGQPLAEYLDQETLTVSVEVSQENVASLSVGDLAEVRVAGESSNGAVFKSLPEEGKPAEGKAPAESETAEQESEAAAGESAAEESEAAAGEVPAERPSDFALGGESGVVAQKEAGEMVSEGWEKGGIPGAPSDILEGRVQSIASSATSERSMSNVTYTVEIALENKDGALAGGMAAYVTFSGKEILNADYVLTKALFETDGTSAKVKIYGENGEIEEVPVTIGETNGRYTVIKEGLKEDATCLIEEKVGASGSRAVPESMDAGEDDSEAEKETGSSDENPEGKKPEQESGSRTADGMEADKKTEDAGKKPSSGKSEQKSGNRTAEEGRMEDERTEGAGGDPASKEPEQGNGSRTSDGGGAKAEGKAESGGAMRTDEKERAGEGMQGGIENEREGK